MAGFSGAAALDAKGQFLGIMETRNFALASAEPTLPPVRLISAATIRAFLASASCAAAQRSGRRRPRRGGADYLRAEITIICRNTAMAGTCPGHLA